MYVRSSDGHGCLSTAFHGVEDERINISRLVDLFRRGLTRSVTCTGIDPNQDRIALRVGVLHGRRKLEAMRGQYPIVVIARSDECRRIVDPFFDVMYG